MRYEQLEFSMLSCLRCDILVTVNTDVFKTIWGTSPPIFEHDEHICIGGGKFDRSRKETNANLLTRHKVHTFHEDFRSTNIEATYQIVEHQMKLKSVEIKWRPFRTSLSCKGVVKGMIADGNCSNNLINYYLCRGYSRLWK